MSLDGIEPIELRFSDSQGSLRRLLHGKHGQQDPARPGNQAADDRITSITWGQGPEPVAENGVRLIRTTCEDKSRRGARLLGQAFGPDLFRVTRADHAGALEVVTYLDAPLSARKRGRNAGGVFPFPSHPSPPQH